MKTQGPNHPSREDLSAFVLGALDATDTAAVSKHVEGCVDCQRVLAEYQAVANGLPFAVPPQTPPPQLRAKLAEVVRGESAAHLDPAARIEPSALHQPAQRPVPPAQSKAQQPVVPVRAGFSLIKIGLGLAVLALLALNVALLLQLLSLQCQHQALLKLLQENQSSLAFVSQPGILTLPTSGTQGEGNLVINREGDQAALFLRNLPELEPGKIYQVWLISPEGAPESAGLFDHQAGQPYVPFLVSPQNSLRNYSMIGVSVEPEGGSPAPTTDPILLVIL